MAPNLVLESDVLRDLKSVVINPASETDLVTCKPDGRLDYFIVFEGLRVLFSCSTVSWQVPRSPHGFVEARIKANPTMEVMLVQRLPKPIPLQTLSGP